MQRKFADVKQNKHVSTHPAQARWAVAISQGYDTRCKQFVFIFTRRHTI